MSAVQIELYSPGFMTVCVKECCVVSFYYVLHPMSSAGLIPDSQGFIGASTG